MEHIYSKNQVLVRQKNRQFLFVLATLVSEIAMRHKMKTDHSETYFNIKMYYHYYSRDWNFNSC